jgi:hypothetical protein
MVVPAGATRRPGRVPLTVIALAVLLVLLIIGALQGGIAMVADPLTPLGMTTDFLERAPVHTYLWPGLFLLGIAAASSITLIGLLLPWRWPWAAAIEKRVGYRWPWLGALLVGAVLLVFEIVELFLVPFHPVMHPLLLAGSAAVAGLVLTRSARAFLRVT